MSAFSAPRASVAKWALECVWPSKSYVPNVGGMLRWRRLAAPTDSVDCLDDRMLADIGLLGSAPCQSSRHVRGLDDNRHRLMNG